MQPGLAEKVLALYSEVQRCEACDLAKLPVNKKRPYPKLGRKPVMVVSLAPSWWRREDIGYVWGGLDKAGIIDVFFGAIGLSPDDVYITNALKCSTYINAQPTKEQLQACKRWLEAELSLVRPKLIICMSRPACESLGVRELGAPVKRVDGSIVVGTFHPAFVKHALKRDPEKIEQYKRHLDTILGLVEELGLR